MQKLECSSPDDLLVEIGRRARQHARRIVASDLADDLSQEVVFEAMMRLRAGLLVVTPGALDGLVAQMVRRRAIDLFRTRTRRDRRHIEHGRELSASVHAWMSPELALEEHDLAALHDRTLAELPSRCRTVYTMVREAETSYQVVAGRLGVSRSAVRLHVVTAQRHFRDALSAEGVTAKRARTKPARTKPAPAKPAPGKPAKVDATPDDGIPRASSGGRR